MFPFNHPTDLAINKWKEGLSKNGNESYAIVRFHEASHGIRKGHHSMHAPFADGYKELMVGWLILHIL